MRARMLAGSALLALLVALLTPVAAFAQPTTTTLHFSLTRSTADVNPCTGAPGTSTDTVQGVTHTTQLPGHGGFYTTTTTTDSFTFVPDDPSQPTYTGKATFRDVGTASTHDNLTFTATSSFHATGSDGSRIAGHVTVHFTLHPDGTVAVEFEKDRLSCP